MRSCPEERLCAQACVYLHVCGLTHTFRHTDPCRGQSAHRRVSTYITSSPADFHRTLCAHCRAHLPFLIICVAVAEHIGTQLAMFPHSQTRRHGSQLLTTVRTSPKEGPLRGRDCVLVVFGSLVPSMGPGTW